MLDFRKLEAFCKVCELGSFSKAGEALFLSQPTISAHIQSLERDFNVRLLDRMTRSVIPTPAGETLFKQAKIAFASLEAAKEEISTLSSEVVGEIFFGSSTIPAHHVLPALLTRFLEKHPKVQPNLIIASSQEVTQKVAEGELMAGIVSIQEPTDSELFFTPLIQDEIVIIAPTNIDVPMLPPKHHRVIDAIIPQISFETAQALNWIVREDSSSTRRSFEIAVKDAGHDPRTLNKRLAVDSSHAALQYVAAGLGVSIASRLAVDDAIRFGRLRALTIQGVVAKRQFSCVINTKRSLFPATSAFLEFLHTDTQHLRQE